MKYRNGSKMVCRWIDVRVRKTRRKTAKCFSDLPFPDETSITFYYLTYYFMVSLEMAAAAGIFKRIYTVSQWENERIKCVEMCLSSAARQLELARYRSTSILWKGFLYFRIASARWRITIHTNFTCHDVIIWFKSKFGQIKAHWSDSSSIW